MSKPFLSCIQNLHLLQMDEIWIKILLSSNVTELDTGEKSVTSTIWNSVILYRFPLYS